MAYPGVIMYAILWHRKAVAASFRRILKFGPQLDGFNDVHARLMSHYKEVPEWWFTIVLVMSSILSLVTLLAYPTSAPWWIIAISLLFSVLLLIPTGIVLAITGLEMNLQTLADFLGGVIKPGNPLVMNMFKVYGYVTSRS